MNIIITSLKSVICFVLSLDKVLWPVLGGKRTRWLCVTMALPSPHQGQPLIPACTDEVRAHRLAKSQIHFHLLGETTPSCCETADLQLTHCHVPDNTASLTPVLCAPCCLWSRPFSRQNVSPPVSAHIRHAFLQKKKKLPRDIGGHVANWCVVSNTSAPLISLWICSCAATVYRCLSAKTAV